MTSFMHDWRDYAWVPRERRRLVYQTVTGLAAAAIPQLPPRTRKALWRAGVRSWEHVALLSDAQLRGVPDIGPTQVVRIRAAQREREL